MVSRVQGLAAGALILALFASCSDGGTASSELFPEACNLPSPPPGLDVSAVPELFVIDEAVVRNVAQEQDLLIVALNVPAGVEETFERYKAAFATEPFDQIGEDFEGFEAELYLRERGTGYLVALQVRRPNCNEASSVTINLNRVNRDTNKEGN